MDFYPVYMYMGNSSRAFIIERVCDRSQGSYYNETSDERVKKFWVLILLGIGEINEDFGSNL